MRLAAVCLLLVLLSGCNESFRPAKREAPDKSATPQDPAAPPATTSASDSASSDAGNVAPAGEGGGELDLGAIRLTAPKTWTRQQPRSSFVLAEFALPRAEGDSQDGRLTVSTAGGSVQANIDRWRGQFEGKPGRDTQKTLEVAGLTITIVDLSGTFLDQPGPFAPGVKREGFRVLAAVIPTPEQLHFVKCYGPEKTIARHAEAFEPFLKTLEMK
jgi:hypothetical protein